MPDQETLQAATHDEGAHVAAPPRTVDAGRPRRTARLVELGLVLGLLALSLAAWARIWISGDFTKAATSRTGDVAQETWFLAWLPHALLHGHNPFHTGALWAGSGGVNVLANPSDLLPALVLSPVTLAFGPIASLNVGALLAPVVSGWAMFLLARRLVRFVPAQLAASLLWGFSPFVMRNIPQGHLNLGLEFFPPLLVLLLLELVSHRRPARLVGAAIGALVVVQFFTGAEVLVITLMTVGFGCLVAALASWRAVAALRARIVEAAMVAVPIVAVCLAYPVWYMLHGPRAFSGPLWVQQGAGQSVADVVRRGPTHVASSIFGGYFGSPGPNPEYLGPVLLVALALSLPVVLRRPIARSALVVGIFAWLLSMGLQFQAASPVPEAGWSLWRLFDHVPLIEDITANRFSVIVAGSAAVLMALALDAWWQRLRARSAGGGDQPLRRRPSERRVAPVLCLAGAAVLAPIFAGYSLPFATRALDTAPPWFTTAARHLAPGTRVLVMPYAELIFDTQSMVWQAEDDLHFDLAEGYAAVPGGDGVHDTWYMPLPGAPSLLLQPAIDSLSLTPSKRWTPAEVSTVRRALHRWHVQVVVVCEYQEWSSVTEMQNMEAVLGRPPVATGAVWVWSHVTS